MRLSVAQLRSTAGDILGNLAKHEVAVRRAVELRAELVLFPELSLTGYEPALAQRLAVRANDSRLDRLQTLSDDNEIIICAGMPLSGDIGIEIAMFLYQPHGDEWHQTHNNWTAAACCRFLIISLLLRSGTPTLPRSM